MKYVINGCELLLSDDNGSLRSVTAMEIWKNECESQNNPSRLPSLSAVGLWLDAAYASISARLERSSTGDFGVVRLHCVDSEGNEAVLSASHSSDCVVLNGKVSPLRPRELDHIVKELVGLGIDIDSDLSFSGYLACVKASESVSWISIVWRFDARELSVQARTRPDSEVPSCFVAELSDYQIEGSSWLSEMIKQGVGVILGDGMGLGKTVQMIKAICDKLESDPGARTLIVCPSALVENWRREIMRFTQGIDVKCHFGPDRSRYYKDIDASIVVTTYDVARIDSFLLRQYLWDIVALDEAQFIKNPDSQRTKAIKDIPRRVGIVITGTPFENHMTDVWSLVDYCCPGFLGTKTEFVNRFRDEEVSAADLGKIVAPLLLRRTLADVPNDLPEFIQIPMPIALLPEEAREYDRRRVQYQRDGASLGAIVKLVGDLATPYTDSDAISRLKYDYLRTVAEGVFGEGEKIIVFAQRLQTVAFLREYYSKMVPTFTLTGDDPIIDRMPIIDEFSAVKNAAMLICNPVVGGAGLNITSANHIFHFSPQWNPAVIDQADARAHRRGQKKAVVAYYPYYVSTVEEYMWEKVLTKRELSAKVIIGNKGDSSTSEILEALSMSPCGN